MKLIASKVMTFLQKQIIFLTNYFLQGLNTGLLKKSEGL